MKKILLACIVAIAPLATLTAQPAQAQTPGDIGKLMGDSMCKELKTTGTFFSDSSMEGIVNEVMAKYGDNGGKILLDMAAIFNDPTAIANDPEGFALFRSFFEYMIDDEDCFRAFLATQVFNDNMPTVGTPQK